MLLLFGLRGVMSLIFKEETIDETQIQKQQMTMGMGNMGQDPQKAFEQERAALDAVSHLLRNHNACIVLLGFDFCDKQHRWIFELQPIVPLLAFMGVMSSPALECMMHAILAAQSSSWVGAFASCCLDL